MAKEQVVEGVEHAVKYLEFEVNVTGMGGMSPKEAEEIVKGYLDAGFTLSYTNITNISNKGFFAVHVLVK